MSGIERKNGWQLAEHAREATPYGMQRLLSQAVWDVDLVRDALRDYVYEHLGTQGGILVIDETSFPKRGEKSAGVQVQYCGTTGQVENCQVAVLLDYVTARGHALIDRELYLPKEWIDDPERCREVGIPDTVRFKTKCQQARQMVERVSKTQIPISWVVADTVYGSNLELRTWLEAHGYQYVLAVPCDEPVGIRTPDGRRRLVEVREVEALVLNEEDWQRLSMSDGTKGPRLFDWACVPILHRWEDDGRHWLLMRRGITDPKQKAYYFVFASPTTTLHEMVQAIGARWRIEEDFETSKDMGLGQYEVRSFIGWYRHITLVMLAHAFLAILCAETQASPPGVFPSLLAPDISPTLPALDASSPLPISGVSSPLPALNAAPLTVPEIRHLLGKLIWPSACNTKQVLAWSWWRRRHRGMASYYHTRHRLKAG